MARVVHYLVSWAFALLAVAVTWNADIVSRLDRVATQLGATQPGFLRRVIVDGGTPFVLTAIAALTSVIYLRLVWPWLPGSEFRGGWWVYTLRANRVAVVGYFRLDHSIDGARVPYGHAFYVTDTGLEHRGDWSAETVHIQKERIRLLFSMHAVNPKPEALPSRYDGFLEVRNVDERPVVGKKKATWRGFFHDLEDRRNILGHVYAEWLGRFRRGETLKQLLTDRRADLVSRLPS